MQLVRYNPRQHVLSRQNCRGSLFDGFFDDFFGPALQRAGSVNSRENSGLHVDIYENDSAVVINAELPGVAKEDIKLDVKGKYLTLGGERKREEEVKDARHYRREIAFGSFERTFSLPFEIDADKVTAKFENGILRLEIAKPEEQQQKRITIN